jgi:alanyl-tRNA synthetase
MPVGEPGGPDSEMFWDFGADLKIHETSPYKDKPCHPACDCGRFLEIGNNVFMEYLKTESGFQPLEKKNIDFGGGLERLSTAVLDNPDIFMIDLFDGMRLKLEELSNKKYGESEEITNSFRIVMDHLRGATFIMGDDRGVAPSNTDQGYIVRRLIRRAIRYGKQLGIEQKLWTKEIVSMVIKEYEDTYPELVRNKDFILEQLDKEETQFLKTLEKGLRELEKGIDPFVLFTTYGFPIEMTEEIAKEKGIKIDVKDFEEKMKQHQELSRTAAVGKFKGGLADSSEETTCLHTAAHLLLAALREVLGSEVQQKGSNITAERLRFDFSHGEKITDEQKIEVEKLVNEAIKKDLDVICEEMSLEEAQRLGATGSFESKYGERVKVYKIGDGKEIFSYEICGGPHVDRIGELGRFKIIKEGSSSAGVRRIKAILG